VRTLSKSEWFL
jgi:hypothetical protein